MAFNWFRRSSNESSDNPNQEQPQTPPSSESPPESNDGTNATTPADTTASDMLAFAKAAYKNMQQKQQVDAVESPSQPEALETSTSEAIVEASPQPETLEAATETVELTPPETVITPTETVELTPHSEVVEISTPEVIAQAPPQPEAVVTPTPEVIPQTPPRSEIVEVTSVTESSPIAASSLLQKAAAERQARQERLIANAIETQTPPSPPPSEVLETASENSNPVETPELIFDEGFLWSAEVLAAQGRRAEDVSIEEINWLKKLRLGLSKTRRNIVNQLKSIVGQGPLNQAAVMEIEALLLQADVGVEATDYIIEALQDKLRSDVLPPDAAIAYLKQIIRDMLDAPIQQSQKAVFAPEKETLNIWMMTGVNGAGKTTTIGKLAHLAQKSGYKTLIGAADTFRAAAVEQVKVWGTRSNVEVISNPGKNTDPAAVVYDAITAATARDIELLLVDTAGRLQNKKNLMEELSKVRRIIDKKAPNAKVESLLVLDATLGQNGLRQAQVFSEAAQLSGVVLTKLDGTAKGGVALAVVKQLGLPIRFIGAGEGIEDLRPFSSYEFVEALLSGE